MTLARMLTIAAALAAVLAAPPSALAAGLAPTKPSQVVTLINRSTNDCPASGEAMDEQVLPDGTTQPFTIPAKQVFVVTELNWGTALSNSPAVLVALSVQVPAATEAIPFFSEVKPTDSVGNASSSVLIANAIVRSGATLCAGNIGGGTFTQVIVRGFLAKDR